MRSESVGSPSTRRARASSDSSTAYSCRPAYPGAGVISIPRRASAMRSISRTRSAETPRSRAIAGRERGGSLRKRSSSTCTQRELESAVNPSRTRWRSSSSTRGAEGAGFSRIPSARSARVSIFWIVVHETPSCALSSRILRGGSRRWRSVSTILQRGSRSSSNPSRTRARCSSLRGEDHGRRLGSPSCAQPASSISSTSAGVRPSSPAMSARERPATKRSCKTTRVGPSSSAAKPSRSRSCST